MAIIVLVIIALVIVIFYLAINYSIKKIREKSIKSSMIGFLILIPFLFLAYSIFTDVFPNDSFYQYDFEQDTKLKFNPDWIIGRKYATFPDTFGDYESAFILTVNEKDYQNIYNHFKTDSSYQSTIPDEFISAFTPSQRNNVLEKRIINKEGGKFVYLLFLSDNKSIIYRRMSW